MLPCLGPSFTFEKAWGYLPFSCVCFYVALSSFWKLWVMSMEKKSPFPSCQQVTERKSNPVPQAALGLSLLSTSEKLFAPHCLPMLRKGLEQGAKSHSFVHQKFKGTIYALNLSYLCLYHCFKIMAMWVSCILPLLQQMWLHEGAAGGWPWGWVQSALGTLQSPLTYVSSFFFVEKEVFLWSNCPSIKAG